MVRHLLPTHQVHLDPHIPIIPGFLVSFVLGVLAPYIYNVRAGPPCPPALQLSTSPPC